MSDDHIVTPMSAITPENWAAVITKRPGMYLGGLSASSAASITR